MARADAPVAAPVAAAVAGGREMRGSDGVPGPGGPWVLLLHQVPTKPDYLRVKVRRRLQRLGAVALKNAVYVLPNAEGPVEDFAWLLREIVADGGEGVLCAASLVAGLDDAEIEAMFRRDRDADYAEVTIAAAQLARGVLAPDSAGTAAEVPAGVPAVAAVAAELARLRRHLGHGREQGACSPAVSHAGFGASV